MKCGQGKPFTVTSSNAKMGGSAIRSYEKGGMVTKPAPASADSGIYTAEMGAPPLNTDMMTALTPAERKAAEARMKAEPKKKK